jgi:hypothetical protein
MANLSMLATDENNADFVGARNPDDLLYVRFHEVPLQNNFQTEKQGRPIFDTIIFTEITTPGNQLNIIDRPKNSQDEFRFPRQWAHYKNTHSEDPAKQGTPLSQWPMLDVAKIEMLRAMKFYTVEAVAYASDEQIMHLGMLAGMAPLTFRDRAKAYLEVARDANAVSKKDEELKETKAKLAELEAKMNALLEAKVAPVEKPKRQMSEEHKAALKAGREAAKLRKAEQVT